jgi:hypothetical protein
MAITSPRSEGASRPSCNRKTTGGAGVGGAGINQCTLSMNHHRYYFCQVRGGQQAQLPTGVTERWREGDVERRE